MLNPLDTLKLYALPLAVSAAFGFGLYVSHVWHVYEESKQLKAIQDNVISQDKLNRKEVSDLQTSNANTETNYQFVKDELNVLKQKKQVTNVPCSLSPSAVSVWNSSIDSVPKAPAGTTEATPEVATTGGIPIEDVITNEVENKRRFDLNQAQIDAIIKWEVDTYGTQ